MRIAVNLGLGLTAAAVATLTARHFALSGWPLAHADGWLVAGAGLLFLAAYGFKALGWRRVFARGPRPRRLALAAATGAASVTGMALPGRFDDVVRVAVVRRFRGSRAGIGAIVLSIVLVGFLDSAALAPLASVAAGLGAALIVVVMPRLAGVRQLGGFRIVRWLAVHSTGTIEAAKALVLISASWAARAVALYLLLGALGVSDSFVLALLFLCASAASSALPVAPAGAATQAGAGAAVLALSGVPASQAVAFAVAAQALLVLAGAAVVVAAGAWEARARFRPVLVSRY